MACGATLKRPMEFEAALLSPGSPKRRRCAPLPGPTPGLRPPDAEPPPLQMQTPPPTLQPPAPPGSERRLPTPEQIFQNIKQEYSRYQRWRHLEVVLNQNEACPSESQSHSSALRGRSRFTFLSVTRRLDPLVSFPQILLRGAHVQLLDLCFGNPCPKLLTDCSSPCCQG
ncbi:akirin 1 [Rhinolophus ferrumequinum]|uniref:Akirin 1 n=1 Tax=Rhinolophus ferrumequinum TaxID=59479 RepID=A0A7J7X2Z8_RHIFE|nr:akirin 1 [Rhinolophus ferrumequinum]